MKKMNNVLKRILNIVFYIICICIVILVYLFSTSYKFNKVIKDYNSYKLYKNSKYVSIDMGQIEKERLTVSDTNNYSYDYYIIKLGKENILVLLTRESPISNKVDIMKKKDNKFVFNIKKKLDDRNLSNNDIYYTNENIYDSNEKIKTKNYFLYAIIGLIVFLIMKEVILLILKK